MFVVAVVDKVVEVGVDVSIVMIAARHSFLQEVMQLPSFQTIFTAQSGEEEGQCTLSPSTLLSMVRFLMEPGAALYQGLEAYNATPWNSFG